ncbi:hypothetical protein JYT11_00735, partial [Planctomycetaceae bacterium AH-315-I19]|nr:hypothetical protein [Planctomycetaceae bacterium AH-315-I19]
NRFLGIDLTNEGLMNVFDDTSINRSNGVHSNSGVITVNTASTLTVTGAGMVTFTNETNGRIEGSGTINLANTDVFVNNGTFAPDDGGETATLTIIGDWNQSALGALEIDIFGSGARGLSNDLLDITLDATLDGLLVVSTFGNVNPSDSFVVLEALNYTGLFSNTAGGTVATTNGGQFDVIYNGATVTLTNFVPTPGSMSLLGIAMLAGLRRKR